MQAPAEGQFVVLNDEPVDGGHRDLLGTADTANRLADLIVASRRSTPFTLAIDAGWGMGKSSLMRQLQRRLDDVNGMHTVWFNAWTSGSDALEVLIKSVFMRFDRNVVRRAYNRVVNSKRIFGVVRIALALAMGLLGLRRLVDQLWSQLSIDAKSRNEIREVVREMAQDWASTPSTSGRQIVVFVDDLDRCSHDVVLTVCEAIKLYLDVPGLVFVIGCDQSALSRNLKRSNTTSAQAAEYLEKIVQVNYHAPLPDQQQVRELINGYADQSGTLQLFGDELSRFVADRTGRNPRRIKRLINSFVLEYHLDREWQEFGADILVRILLLQHFYPSFYRLLASAGERDPVQEFLEYRDVRAGVRLGEVRSEDWERVFASHGIEAPDQKDDRSLLFKALDELEQELPEPLPSLAADDEFAATLRQLQDFPEFARLRGHLQRRRFRFNSDHVATPAEPLSDESNDLRGLRVLVVDDVFGLAGDESKFSDTGRLASTLQDWGATVATASDYESMERELRYTKPDLIVSDINRHGRENAGLEDLQRLRERDLYMGPVVFYVARVTPGRRKWADELGAIGVTNSAGQALEWVRMARRSADRADIGARWDGS